MLTAQQIREKLEDRNFSAVARGSGVHVNSIYRLLSGADPSYKTLKKLSDYFESQCRPLVKECQQ